MHDFLCYTYFQEIASYTKNKATLTFYDLMMHGISTKNNAPWLIMNFFFQNSISENAY